MKSSANITNTQARLEKALNKTNTRLNSKQVQNKIKEALDNASIQIATPVIFFPDLDRCKCRLNNGEVVTAKIMHRYCGGLIEQFTPDGDYDFNIEEQNVLIKPRINYKCLLLRLNDNLADYIMLGYYLEDNDPKPIGANLNGFKLSSQGATDEYYIRLENGYLTCKLSGIELLLGGGEEEFIEYIKKLKEKIKRLDEQITELDTLISTVNSKLNRFAGETKEELLIVNKDILSLDARIKALEKHKVLKMGRYKYNGEGELEEINQIIYLNLEQHSLGMYT